MHAVLYHLAVLFIVDLKFCCRTTKAEPDVLAAQNSGSENGAHLDKFVHNFKMYGLK